MAAHKDPLRCGICWLAMWFVVRTYLAGLPMPDPRVGKASWYYTFMFCTDRPTEAVAAQQQYKQYLDMLQGAGVLPLGC